MKKKSTVLLWRFHRIPYISTGWNCSFFDVGIFTNLTQDHLDFHETMEKYAEAKAMLFKMCTAGIINSDDPNHKKIIEGSASINFSFAIDDNSADFVAKNVRLRADGADFELLSKDGISRVETNIPGRFSVYNTPGGYRSSQGHRGVNGGYRKRH